MPIPPESRPSDPSHPIEDGSKAVEPQKTASPESGFGQPDPAIAPQVPPSPAQEHQPERRKDNTPAWKKTAEIAAILIAGGLLVVNIFALSAAKKAANAAQSAAKTASDQTALLRDQLSGTLAAAIPQEPPYPPTITNDLKHLKFTGIGFNFSNVGKVSAKHFIAEATMTRESLPGFQPLGDPQHKEITQADMRPHEQNGQHGIVSDGYLKFETAEFSEADLWRLGHYGETVEIKGHFQYDNGFKETITQPFCFIFVKVQNETFEHGTVGTGNIESWVPCEDGKSMITQQALKLKQKP
jgi:hypothetical protein